MAISSFNRISGATGQSSAIDSVTLPSENANVWYSFTPESNFLGTYIITKSDLTAVHSLLFINTVTGFSYTTSISSSSAQGTAILTEEADKVFYYSSISGASLTADRASSSVTPQVESFNPVQEITSSTTGLVFDNYVFAVLLGGGGAGGAARSVPYYSGSYARGGGGGSGYLSSGVIPPGTYNAIIGGTGGTTSIGPLSAAGGEGGESETYGGWGQTYYGNGGAGGSGGGSGGNGIGGVRGANGSGSNAIPGVGSGISFANLLDAQALFTDPTSQTPGGVYTGGNGGVSGNVNGQNATQPGAGGNGASSDRTEAFQSGGAGGSGKIWYRKLI